MTSPTDPDIGAVAEPAVSRRRHDLDALRAWAMLIGIGLHAAMSLLPRVPPGTIRDDRSSHGLALFLEAVHGFRMPRFFVLSGYFTALLWRRRGLRSLVKNRLQRIGLPILFPGLPIILATFAVGGWVAEIQKTDPGRTAAVETDAKADAKTDETQPAMTPAERIGRDGLYAAVVAGNIESLQTFLAAGADPNRLADDGGSSPLSLAVLLGRTELVGLLLEGGADPNLANRDGDTPVHTAAFLGRDGSARLLLDAGGDTGRRNNNALTPVDVLGTDWGTTKFILDLLKLEVDRDELQAGRDAVAALMRVDPPPRSTPTRDLLRALTTFPVFLHLWFLRDLLWLVGFFTLFTLVASRWTLASPLARRLILSPWRYAWLVPLTFVFQRLMTQPAFGPDTAVGLLPQPHLLAYYAVFYFYGAMLWDAETAPPDAPGPVGPAGPVGRGWWWLLPTSLLVLFPLGIDLSSGRFGWTEAIDAETRAVLGDIVQSAYVWTMTFGCFGLFARLVPSESRVMRYLSDSSYWLYLAHLPLVQVTQIWVRHWELPAVVKWGLITAGCSVVLLASYQLLVRWSPLGWILNGRRVRWRRPARATSASPTAAAAGPDGPRTRPSSDAEPSVRS